MGTVAPGAASTNMSIHVCWLQMAGKGLSALTLSGPLGVCRAAGVEQLYTSPYYKPVCQGRRRLGRW
ncbi:hypothetical protein AG1IA_04855 [Rhizoctonia solani AG-1 IA]|uniref:Uncharacterized protein n=1 Tax=Thanatephorus cucumeris (strain AG1-IA) TaxID=983506 RepID=L8WWF1_THACA|nr:hypothetical protein AG1IA_04855 [Rhizoctonia solani AG-1 IA]